MGLFTKVVFTDGEGKNRVDAETWLSIEIHDSDVADVQFSAPNEQGRFYLGFQPRDYFADPDASAPVDNDREAEGFVRWANTALGVRVDGAAVRPLFADEGIDEPVDVFVEETVTTLLSALGLPLPDELTGQAG